MCRNKGFNWNFYFLQITASDSRELNQPGVNASFVLHVTDVNDNKPEFSHGTCI